VKAVGLKTLFIVRFKLKRSVLFIFLILALAAMVSAQGWGNRGIPRPQASEDVTISGSMIVANGFPALKSGDVTYFVSGISRLVGFIDGLKEGAQVTIEGQARPASQDGKLKILHPKKMTLNGKSYDLALPELNMNFWRGFPPNAMPGPRHMLPQAPQQPPRQMPMQPWGPYGRQPKRHW
jgi:hypothetical protein